MTDAFHFEDFIDKELKEILDLNLKKQGLEATEDAKTVVIELLSRARDRPNFGNAGEVENLISRAKESEQRRRLSLDPAICGSDIIFLPQDFDENFDRARNSAASCRKLFADIVGCEKLIRKLESYQRIVVSMRARNSDPREQIPFNFIFKGPPGKLLWSFTSCATPSDMVQARGRRPLLGKWPNCIMRWAYYQQKTTWIAQHQTSSASTLGKPGRKLEMY